MSITYMFIWSTLIIFAVGLGRIRNIRQTFGVTAVTLLILILSQTLTMQLAASVGLEPSLIFTAPEAFLRSGPVGWLALLVMPCGWLGPIVGMNLISRRFEDVSFS